jgi:DNA modification methylase
VNRKDFGKGIKPVRDSRRQTGRWVRQQSEKPLWEPIPAFKIHHGDVIEQLKQYPGNYFDASFADPPYGLSFMGAKWDHGVPSVEVWEELYRVLKPGASILMFGGTRTHHRQTCAIEAAGFEIRDTLMWLYGSGFPKSQKFANDKTLERWQGYGMALKPAYEPCTLAMKPNDGTFANNARDRGVAGLNIDGCRVGERWPANLILQEATIQEEWARYFYASKVSKREREAGLSRFGKKKHGQSGGAQQAIKEGQNYKEGQEIGLNKVKEVANNHPCLKPIDLCRYLAHLLLPPAQKGKTRKLFVPFSGSGSEMIGALLAGWDQVTGIEIDSRYTKIAKARIEHWTEENKAA